MSGEFCLAAGVGVVPECRRETAKRLYGKGRARLYTNAACLLRTQRRPQRKGQESRGRRSSRHFGPAFLCANTALKPPLSSIQWLSL
jgi:hypothetical protein